MRRRSRRQVALLPIVWAAIIVGALIGLVLYALVSLAMRAAMPRAA
jgi:ABC-type nitrate/sulfonate/bicarbonate transport system permease component